MKQLSDLKTRPLNLPARRLHLPWTPHGTQLHFEGFSRVHHERLMCASCAPGVRLACAWRVHLT